VPIYENLTGKSTGVLGWDDVGDVDT